MIGTDLIALFLAPVWAAIKDKIPLAATWHPWVLAGITAAIIAATTALGLGPGGWPDWFWNTVTIVGSVFTGYTVAKPVETMGSSKVVPIAVLLLGLLALGPLGVAMADGELLDSLATDSVPAASTGEAVARTFTFWFGIIGGIIARLIRRKIG